MDAKEFVREVVVPNCEEFKADPTSFRKLWNAVVSMNTVPEWMAFDRVGYTSLKQSEIETAYKDVRKQHPEFGPIKAGTEMLKHVRLLADGKVTVSSTGIQVDDPKTWVLKEGPKSRSLGDILDQARGALSSIFPSS